LYTSVTESSAARRRAGLFIAHDPPLELRTRHAEPSAGSPEARKRKFGGGNGVPATPRRSGAAGAAGAAAAEARGVVPLVQLETKGW
jgi:hypothetical protein